MRAPIILCVMGAVLLRGTPVPAEASPSETPAAVPSEEAQEQVQLKRPLRPLRTLLERALSESASDAGTSETIFRSRIQVRYEHRDRRDDAVEDKIVFRIDRPLFNDRLYFRVDVPYLQFDPRKSGDTTSKDLGDVLIRIGTLLVHRPKLSFFAGTDVIFPTGSQEDAGRGKYQLGPGVAAEVPIPELNTLISPLVQHFQSVGGDPSRRTVNYTKFRPKVNTIWAEQWWTSLEPSWIVDWTRSNKTALNLEFELGRKLGKHYRAWVRPGIGVWGDTVIGSYDWQFEAGGICFDSARSRGDMHISCSRSFCKFCLPLLKFLQRSYAQVFARSSALVILTV